MAKAKKPASSNKSATQKPTPDASKPGTSAPDSADQSSTSKASQAGAVKADSKPSDTKATDTAKTGKASDPVKVAASGTKAESVASVSNGPTAKSTSATTSKDSTGDKNAASGGKPASDPVKPSETKETTTKPAVASAPKTSEVKADSKAADTAPKPAQVSKTAKTEPAKQPEKSRSVFWPLVFGGVIAGGLGFAAAEMNFLNTRSDMDGVRETLRQQQDQIAAIDVPDLSGVESSVAELQSGLEEVSNSVASFDARLTELENRPIVTTDGEVAGPSQAFLNDLEAMKASVEAQKNEIDQLLQDAQELDVLRSEVQEQNSEIARLLDNAQSVEEATAEAARAAAIQAASAKITAALSSGSAYDTAIDDLSSAGITEIPSGLTDHASDGVATLLSLQTEFPAAARAGLSSARAAGLDEGPGGVGGFLKRQLGARSVAPRDGSDPDAVLSRAEAAVRQGRVGDALTELDTLPAEVQSAMEDWLAKARDRAAAEAAVQDLSERLTAN